MTLVKQFGRAAVVSCVLLCSCQSTILHKDGMKEAVTEPIVRTLDDKFDRLLAEIDVRGLSDSVRDATESLTRLTNSIKASSETTQKTVTETLEKFGALADTLNEKLQDAGPVIQDTGELISELKTTSKTINELLERFKKDFDSTTTESIWTKIIPALIIFIAILIAVLLITRSIKKNAK